jgi:acetoin utilization deacetylase AcuC-like enzyme
MFFYNPSAQKNLSDFGIAIPMLSTRYQKVLEYVQANFNPSLLQIGPADLLSEDKLRLAHSQNFIERLRLEPTSELLTTYELLNSDGSYHRYDPRSAKYPLAKITEAIYADIATTVASVLAVDQTGFTFHIGGGHHHAMTNQGRGFCLLNDIVIAGRVAQRELGVKNIWIIDLDAHKGDGTAEITQADESITTLSIHMKEGWPLDQGDGSEAWFTPSSLDIPVAENENQLYLSKLAQGLDQLEKNYPLADLCIVVAGSDPYEKDALPSTSLLKLTKNQMLERDLMVFHFLVELGVPQCYVMAGGYGDYAHEPYINFLSHIKHTIIK